MTETIQSGGQLRLKIRMEGGVGAMTAIGEGTVCVSAWELACSEMSRREILGNDF